ncbi:alpha/beta fold hydrolase [Nocardioides sp. GXZ039]|uniref:alpha/beta fold hydrolase n=1 Tax=Nocardioides sp. GXZ039 TaxID=3136018 RepID=UPI0030F4884C
MSEGSVQTDPHKIHYVEAGRGYPLVMLHGSGPGATGLSNFSPNIAELSRRFRVILPDMPGWGDSDSVAAQERDHVASLVGFLDELGIARAAFAGNSMGGATLLRMATLHPERMSHLVTMGSGVGQGGYLSFAPGDGPTEGLKILREAYVEQTEESMRRLVDIMTFQTPENADDIVRERLDTLLARPDHARHFLDGFGARHKRAQIEALRSVTVPTMLIHGRDDRVVHFENSLQINSLIPDSRLVLINRCGHWTQLEHAGEFNRLVAGFVLGSRVDATA